MGIVCCGIEEHASVHRGRGARKRRYFPGHVHFARWIFRQRRGAIAPWAIVVTSWHEAKACAHIIAAARTGCCNGLRPDARRPQLRECEGVVEPGQLANVAVSQMIVVLPNDESAPKAANWVHCWPSSIAKLPTYAVCDDGSDLDDALSSVAQSFREFQHRATQPQLIEGGVHWVRALDLVDSGLSSPAEEQHPQVTYTSARQTVPASVLAVVSKGNFKRLCFRTMPEPMYIELNPWLQPH